MALDKNTKVQKLFIDYPNIGEILRPLSLEFVVNEDVTVEDIANKANLENDALVNDLQLFIEDEAVTNYVNHTPQDLSKTVHDRYIEDFKDELPVLHEYIKKVSDKILKDENVHQAYDQLKENIEAYINLLEDTVHPLIEDSKPSDVYNAELQKKEVEIIDDLYTVKRLTNEYNSDNTNSEVSFVYKRLERLEKQVTEMIALEHLIRRQ